MVELVVEKTAVGDFQVGKTGTFEISLVNNGPTEDPGPITVTDVLPDGLTFHSSPDNNVQVDGNTVIWALEDGLQVDESVTLTLVVNVQQGAYPEVTNTVTVDSAAEKTPESMLSDSATVNVGAADPLPITGGDMAALWVLLALLLLLGGTAAVLHARRSLHPPRWPSRESGVRAAAFTPVPTRWCGRGGGRSRGARASWGGPRRDPE